MLSYELCKQLKEAGFPQTGDGYFSLNDKKYVYIPTLSELIEAIGDKFESICLMGKNDWLASSSIFIVNRCPKCGQKEDSYQDQYNETAETPEIAVAKLYLKLNKK